jgi:trk system potassium uptake protein TrkH
MNFGSGRSVRRFVKNVFFTTLIIEAIGAVLSFCVFIQDYPLSRAAWISIFHSIAAFNNSGFDILGGFQSISAYKGDVFLNIVTAVLIFLGGIGFLVIKEVGQKRFKWKKFSRHTKVVLLVSAVLTVVGTVLLKLANEITWLGAFFMSVSARTAGFATYSLGGFTNAGLMVMLALMIIGASPGSTGGGIKTSTLFVLLQGIRSSATNKSEKAFKYRIPRDAFKKAAVITLFALSVIVIASFVMCMLEPHIAMSDILVEITSAMGTVGLSTGITPTLSAPSKLLTALIMYIGRLGPWTIVTMWSFSREERISYPEGNIAIG